MNRIALVLFLAACGGAQTQSSGVDDDCPSIDDACMDEAALAACEARAAECPGQVVVMESCPLQFSCEGGDAADDSADDAIGEPTEECTDGDTRPAEDGCNTCTCSEGTWGCTELGCGDEVPVPG